MLTEAVSSRTHTGAAPCRRPSPASPVGGDRPWVTSSTVPAGFVDELADKLFVESAIERDARHSMENLKAICEAKVLAPA